VFEGNISLIIVENLTSYLNSGMIHYKKGKTVCAFINNLLTSIAVDDKISIK
jgi:hypothetical protein